MAKGAAPKPPSPRHRAAVGSAFCPVTTFNSSKNCGSSSMGRMMVWRTASEIVKCTIICREPRVTVSSYSSHGISKCLKKSKQLSATVTGI